MKRELTDDPCQTSFDGTDALVQIMPVQTHTRLEAQTVTRAETDELHDAAGRVDELLGDAGGLFALRSKRRDLPDEGDQMLAEAKVGGGGKCLLKFRNSGIDGGVEEWLKLFIGLSIMGLELWISIGFEIFGELEEDKEAPLEVLSSDPRLMWIVLLSESAK